jgi:hypothetical protein
MSSPAVEQSQQLEPELLECFKRLKLRRMRHLAPQLCLTARTERWRPEELLRVLVEAERKARDESNRQARHRQAGFPTDGAPIGLQLAGQPANAPQLAHAGAPNRRCGSRPAARRARARPRPRLHPGVGLEAPQIRNQPDAVRRAALPSLITPVQSRGRARRAIPPERHSSARPRGLARPAD